MKRTVTVIAVVAGLAGAVAAAGARAQVVPPLPPIPALPGVTPTPTAGAQPNSCIPTPDNHNCPPPPICCNAPAPVDGQGFVPVGADPASLASSGIVIAPAVNLHPVIDYPTAQARMSACDPWAAQHIASAGLINLRMLFLNNGGAGWDGEVWAFATFPGTAWGSTLGGTQWQLWFIDANSGGCFGASYGLSPHAETGTRVGDISPGESRPAPGRFEP